MAAWWKQADAYEAIERQGVVVDIGQVGPDAKRALNRLAEQGVVIKYRGYWDTLLPVIGMGPLKTIWAVPAIAKAAGIQAQA
jgi:hypothetical protein